MKIIYKNEEIAENVPKELSKGDTLIIDGDIYEIFTKTYDFDKSILYAQVELYEETILAVDVINKIYNSNSFISGGFNTNNIEQNPRLLTALIIIASIVGDQHMSRMGILYRKNIISKWNQNSILWNDILEDNPIAKCSDIKTLKEICILLLKRSKISPKIWPKFN